MKEQGIASSGKRKTTMAKLNRERKLIEKRHAKQIRKDARKQAAADGIPSHELRGHDEVDELAVDEARTA